MKAHPPNVPAIILAGGLARRMGGGDKPLHPFGPATLLDHVIARLRPQATPLLLSANGDPARFARFRLPVLPDPLPGHPGPLAGILAGLEWAAAHGHPLVLSAPGDTPFLPPDLVPRLAAASAPIACARSAGRLHPTVALWPTTLAAPLRTALAAGDNRVAAFAAAHGLAAVDWPASPLDPFLNVNTPADLEAAHLQASLATPPPA